MHIDIVMSRTCFGYLSDDIIHSHSVEQGVVQIKHKRQLLRSELPLDVLRVELLCKHDRKSQYHQEE